MRSALFEYALKGLYLALWAYLVLLHPTWSTIGSVLAYMALGTAVGLVLEVGQQLLRGFRPFRNLPGFLLLVLLDSPYFIYLGTVGGLAVGLTAVNDPPPEREYWLIYFAIGGILLGLIFAQLRRLKTPVARVVVGGLMGVALVAGCLLGAEQIPNFDIQNRDLGGILLVGLPFFYLLVFCGETEESEIEIAALCAALGVGLYLLTKSQKLASGLDEYMPGVGDKLIFLIPLMLYFLYATRVLPKLRPFKHSLRGYAYLSLGRVRASLISFGRALQQDRRNELATRGLYQLHQQLDLSNLDPETIPLLNFDFCVKLANDTLVGGEPPTEAKRAEAMRLLDLVEQYRAPLRPKVDYLKAVALTHAKDYDLAAGYLSQLLDPTHPADPEVRKLVLFNGWDLALRLHPEIVRRLGEAELAKPGRRMEAIATVERQLAKTPDDLTALELKTMLYAGLTESEFLAAVPPSPAAPPHEFNYEYVEQLGLALVDEEDPTRVDRGMAYLRIAGRGLPERGPWIFTRLAQAAERRGDAEATRGYLDQVKRAGLLVGPAKLAPDQQALYFAALKKLVDLATARGDYQSAVDDQRTFIEGGKEDVNSLRQLAELNAKNGDVLNALLITERGLIYSKTDPDLLAKRDSYYYSVDVERVKAAREKIAPWFDVTYCLKKARAVADQKEPDLETLDYGLHLVKLARVMQPESHAGMVAEARLLLRKGDRDRGVSLLEDVREQKRGSGEEEEAWFLAVRLLGDLYLNELNRPDLAVSAYTAYREYHKAGAETLFQLAKAYEANGNIAAALRSYDAVTAYKDHPRHWEAADAVRRLKEGA
jgi:tetratricopeptide (TPR) repeat protein